MIVSAAGPVQPRAGRRCAGQALVEFNFSMLLLLGIMLGLLEACRAINAQVVITTVADQVARRTARADSLAVVTSAEVADQVRAEFARFAYMKPSRLQVEVDIDDESPGGLFRTRIVAKYQLGALFVPGMGENVILRSEAKRINRVQVQRE